MSADQLPDHAQRAVCTTNVLHAEVDRLRAENEALKLTLVSLWCYLRLKPGENHRCHGLACGIDACILCLAEGEIKAALQRSGAFDEPEVTT